MWVHIIVHTVIHNTTQNSSDYFSILFSLLTRYNSIVTSTETFAFQARYKAKQTTV